MTPQTAPAVGAPQMRIWLSRDAAAKALGSEAVAKALRQAAEAAGVRLELIRTGSRGMVWLEPMAEIEINGQRCAFGPLTAEDAAALIRAPAAHPKGLGPTEALDWMRRQQRLGFARCGLNDPLDLAAYEAGGGLAGLRAAQGLAPEEITALVRDSGLRGRGGAGFPAGIKWETVRKAPSARKYIICNADEGDSGTFADRMLIEGDPFCLIEGMIIAARAVGASQGYVYLRSEYPDAIRVLDAALGLARAAGLLGPAFDIGLRVGAGAYVCGEETALLNSLEGKRGQVRAKPPLPALEGAFAQPTVVNNVLTLASVPWILAHGAAAYAAYGLGRSRGTMALQIAGNVKRGGLFEAGFGLTLGEVVYDLAGGTASGRPVKAVQVGGPLGAYIPVSAFETRIGYEEFAAIGGLIGHAGFVVFDDSADMLAQARFAMEFCALESCGKCTPCRVGAVRGVETLDRVRAGDASALPLLEDLCSVMTQGSLCALGGFTPYPVLSALRHWPDDFRTSAGLAPAMEDRQ